MRYTDVVRFRKEELMYPVGITLSGCRNNCCTMFNRRCLEGASVVFLEHATDAVCEVVSKRRQCHVCLHGPFVVFPALLYMYNMIAINISELNVHDVKRHRASWSQFVNGTH